MKKYIFLMLVFTGYSTLFAQQQEDLKARFSYVDTLFRKNNTRQIGLKVTIENGSTDDIYLQMRWRFLTGNYAIVCLSIR